VKIVNCICITGSFVHQKVEKTAKWPIKLSTLLSLKRNLQKGNTARSALQESMFRWGQWDIKRWEKQPAHDWTHRRTDMHLRPWPLRHDVFNIWSDEIIRFDSGCVPVNRFSHKGCFYESFVLFCYQTRVVCRPRGFLVYLCTQSFGHSSTVHHWMMMIAFITIKCSLVPLIEGLCAQSYFRFEISLVLSSHLLLFFFGKKKCKEKKQLVQDFMPLPSMYIHMCTLYTYTNTHMLRFSPSGYFGPSRCLILTPGLTSEYPAVCVCVCVYTHMHPHTLPPALTIEKTRTAPLSVLLSKINPHTKQHVQ